MSRVEWHAEGEHDLARSAGLKAVLDAIAFTITAHAVPHSGVDTGRLVNSMDHGIDTEDGTLVAYLGSNAGQPGAQPVEYADYHWADKEAPDHVRRIGKRLRKSIPHPTRKAPTRPYKKAMDELGIVYTVEPGGFEA